MRQFLENQTGLSIYPLFSFVLFGLMFFVMLIWLYTRKSAYIDQMRNLPLVASDEPTPTLTDPKA
jgi:cytochrome c oxidase cbb3-type subunit IV